MDAFGRNKRDLPRSGGSTHSSRWKERDRSSYNKHRSDHGGSCPSEDSRQSEYTSNNRLVSTSRDKQSERDWSKRHGRDRNYKSEHYREDRDGKGSRTGRSSSQADDDINFRRTGSVKERHNDSCRTSNPETSERRDYRSNDMVSDAGWEAPKEDDVIESSDCTNRNLITMGDNRMFNLDAESYRNQPPNSTIMIRGLAQHITENDIRQDILQCSLMPKDIRLIRKKDTGTSRGFAFVEFNTVEEASRWMELKQGVLMLQEQYRAVMHFSIPKEVPFGERHSIKCSQDWYCVKCGAHNFKRRDSCFKCQNYRQDSEGGEGCEEVTHTPTPTILLRGLDVLTTEETVTLAIAPYTALPLVSVRIGQDTLTNLSRGLCYIQMNSIADATQLYNALVLDPPVIDSRTVVVSYRRPVNTAPVGGSDREDLNVHGSANLSQYSLADVPQLAEYSASLYATNPLEHAAYLQYYHQYYQNQLAQGGTITLPTQADSVNAAAALAQAAIHQAMAAKEVKKTIMEPTLTRSGDTLAYEVFKTAQMKSHSAASSSYYPTRVTSIPFVSTPAPGCVYPKYPIPDVSTYQYDETSGYYYDPQTGLYYDATTQYYFNSQTQQFLYWESDLETYTIAPHPPSLHTSEMPAVTLASSSSPDADTGSMPREEAKRGRERPNDKVKVAKKIAKDMERWAKTLNQKKECFRSPASSIVGSNFQPSQKSVGAADAGYAVLERKERAPTEPEENAPPPAGGPLVAAYGGGSESDEEIEDVLQEEKQHINWNTLACLLCKRQFANKETLVRHQQLSDLHKQNLTTWYHVRGLDPDDPQQRNNKYRDRAKERRLKFGEPNAPQPNRLKEKYLQAREDAVSVSYEEPTKAGIGNDNVGNKMLQRMGWSEGMGLGKANQGRTSIIQTKQRVSSAGLGAKGGTYGALPGETYKDCVKKMMFARYQELTDQEQETA